MEEVKVQMYNWGGLQATKLQFHITDHCVASKMFYFF